MDAATLDRDWAVLAGFLPEGWQEMARSTGAMRRGRKVKVPDVLLRILLLHAAAGESLRQATARADAAGLVSISDVALLKRFHNSLPWLAELCRLMALNRPRGSPLPKFLGRRLLAVDATTISKPGSAGTDYRLHLMIELPTLAINHLEVTDASGGETLKRFPLEPRDLILADAGYCHRAGVAKVVDAGADFVVRYTRQSFPLEHEDGRKFYPATEMTKVRGVRPKEWKLWFWAGDKRVSARLCAVKKSAHAAEKERRRILNRASRNNYTLTKASVKLAGYVMVLTSLTEDEATTAEVLDIYRARWQVELVFKRLKTSLSLGHVPKQNPRAAMAWVQAKMLAALLTERLGEEARLFSPWGHQLRGPVP